MPGKAPAVFAPAAAAFRAAVGEDGVPVTVGFFLSVCGDLEGEGFGVLDGRVAVETETGDADYGELDRQDIAPFAAGIVLSGKVVA